MQAYPQTLEGVADFILDWGGYDGSHPKQWVLDQVLRLALGSQYTVWVAAYENDGHEWDEGIAP